MPQVPDLYVSYGMAKSGSTLAFELTRTMLEMAGHSQERLPAAVVHPDYPINFVHTLDKSALEGLQRETACLTGPLVIKTHSNLRPHIAQLLAARKLMGQAICRDPRDIALSMLDAAREGRAWGHGPNGPFRKIEDTIPRIRTQVNHFLSWSACDNILTLHYEQIAFDTESTVLRIADQLGLQVDPPKIIDFVVRRRFIQKNRALRQRWKSEMLADDASKLAVEFADFIQTHCPETDPVPGASTPKKPRFSLSFFKIKGGNTPK